MTERCEIRTSYDLEHFPALDDVLEKVIGRPSDFAGAGFGRRDHGWVCHSEIEAERIKRAIKKLGLIPEHQPKQGEG